MLLFLFIIPSIAFAGIDEIDVKIDGVKLDFPNEKALVMENVVIIPGRVIFEALGVKHNEYLKESMDEIKGFFDDNLISISLGFNQGVVSDGADHCSSRGCSTLTYLGEKWIHSNGQENKQVKQDVFITNLCNKEMASKTDIDQVIKEWYEAYSAGGLNLSEAGQDALFFEMGGCFHEETLRMTAANKVLRDKSDSIRSNLSKINAAVVRFNLNYNGGGTMYAHEGNRNEGTYPFYINQYVKMTLGSDNKPNEAGYDKSLAEIHRKLEKLRHAKAYDFDNSEKSRGLYQVDTRTEEMKLYVEEMMESIQGLTSVLQVKDQSAVYILNIISNSIPSVDIDPTDEIKGLIPKGWHILEGATEDAAQAKGDLNKDGITDIVAIIEGPPITKEVPSRTLIIALGNEDGTYTNSITADKAVLKNDEGGVFGDPFDSITIDRGSVLLKFYGGSNWRWYYSYRFRFQDNDWYLIGATLGSYFNGDRTMDNADEEDYNLLTGDYIIQTVDENGNVITETGNRGARKLIPLKDFIAGEKQFLD
jgi:hypothetical protein